MTNEHLISEAKKTPKKLHFLFVSLAYQKIISLLRQVCAMAGGRRWRGGGPN